MNYDEFAFFNQQLAAMLRDGIPLEGALSRLCADMRRGAPLARSLQTPRGRWRQRQRYAWGADVARRLLSESAQPLDPIERAHGVPLDCCRGRVPRVAHLLLRVDPIFCERLELIRFRH